MRIVAGTYRGRLLQFPKDRTFRPTQDRVKEALFSILMPYLEDAQVLDLFCGTGCLGIEALSRGAQSVVLVDTHTSFVKKNIALFPELNSRTEVLGMPALNYLKTTKKRFDLILLDPPWDGPNRGEALYDQALLALSEFDILAPSGRVVCEHHRTLKLNEYSAFEKGQSRYYGTSTITMFQKKVSVS